MEFKIEGKYPVLRVFLNKGESLLTSSGNMSWMTDKLDYKAHTGGGLGKAFGRLFSGESMFQNTYTALADNQEIALANTMPGEIIHIPMEGQRITAQKDAYLCSVGNVNFEIVFTKKLSAGLFGGEGFILQEFSGIGDLFLESDGSLVEYNLSLGESILVDQGHVFMFENTVSYEIETIKGMKNVLFGGEGFFLVKLTGPGKIMLQTMPIHVLSGEISKYIPTKTN